MKNKVLAWDYKAWLEYLSWLNQDRKLFRKINRLIRSIYRNGYDCGIGEPEPLKYDKQVWSRRINQKDRLVYTVVKNRIIIISCRYHYHK